MAGEAVFENGQNASCADIASLRCATQLSDFAYLVVGT
jgi:hypothetical protein